MEKISRVDLSILGTNNPHKPAKSVIYIFIYISNFPNVFFTSTTCTNQNIISFKPLCLFYFDFKRNNFYIGEVQLVCIKCYIISS